MLDAKYNIQKEIDGITEELVSNLGTLIGVRSVREDAEPGLPFGKGPAKALETMLEIAKGLGFAVRNVDNYVGIIDSNPKKETTLGILCHLDVVPEGGNWHTDPYKMVQENGYLFGRGVSDDKGPAMAVLYAMLLIKKLEIKLSGNVRFIVGTDEECGSSDLRYYMEKEKLPDRLFTPDATYPVINLEKGQLRTEFSKSFKSTGSKTVLSLKGGTVINAVPEKCEATVRGFTSKALRDVVDRVTRDTRFTFLEDGNDITITCHGKSAHASAPVIGHNALTSMITLLGALETDDETGKGFSVLSKVFEYDEWKGEKLGIKMYDKKSGNLTMVHSIAEYNGSEYTGKIDIRFPICTCKAELQKKIESTFKKNDIKATLFFGAEPHYVDENSEFVQTLLRVYEGVTGKTGECIAIGGGTYVHETTGGVAFGAEVQGEDNHVHGADERISIDVLKMNVRMFTEAIYELCK